MSNIIIKQTVVGEVMTNCYLCGNAETKETVIFDPGDNADRIISLIEKSGLKPIAVFLTHGHFDHILAADELREHYGIEIYAYETEKKLLSEPAMNLSFYHGKPLGLKPDIFVKDGEHIKKAGMDFRVIYTPGHTSGSCCYLLEDEKILFSGDTMFYESYGRTDFVTGSQSAIIHSIKEKLLALDDDTVVYPGHDISTTIGNERLMY